MSRPASGDDAVLVNAREAIASARTVEQLRQAQAVVLPLDYAMSLADTAQVIGVSPGWACQLRKRFMRGQVVGAPDAPTPGGRKRENMSVAQEREFLAPFLESAASGGVLVVGQIKAALDKRLGREVARASAYNLLHRHNWRKLAPDKRHPQSDPVAQEEWKKIPEILTQIRKDWAQDQPIKLMFQDEARFGRISDVRRCWAPKPIRPLCQGMLTHEYTCVFGAVDVCTGELDSLILPHVNTGCMQLFLNEVSQRHPDERIVMVIDGAGWHRSNALKAPDNIYLLKLPPYAPELNPIEHVWDELREKFFHNRVFKSLDALEDYLTGALKTLEADATTVGSIVSWPWIVAALLTSYMN